MVIVDMANKQYIETANDAAALFRENIGIAGEHEGVFLLLLSDDGKVLKEPFLVALGEDKGKAEVKLGDIFSEAYKTDAKAIIVAHNHPSGDPKPSKEDLEFTASIKDICERLGNIKFLDHLIIGSPESAGGLGFVSISEISA